MTDRAPAVTGKPLRWLRLDGLVLLAATLILFAATHQPWWLVPAVILLPDLFMLGYLRGTRVGAAVYNLGHSYLLPAAMSLAGRRRPPPADPRTGAALAGAYRHGPAGPLRPEVRPELPAHPPRRPFL